MKKFYVIGIFLFCFSVAFSQQINQEPEIVGDKFDESTAHEIFNIPLNLNSSVVPIWEEDFSGGFPNSWSTYTSNTQGGASTCPWVYSMDGSWGYWQGSSGTSAGTAIASTTAANGFLISDIDSANHHVNGQPSGTTYQYIDSYFTTSAIDLANYPAVTLEFEQYLRFNNLGGAQFIPPTVSVSTDSVTWTDFLVYGSASNNVATDNSDLVSLNITNVAGGSPTVYLRFGWSARVYFWMIDDIKIIETVPNKLNFSEETFGGWWIGYAASGNEYGADYTFYPLAQAQANPYRFEGVIENQGSDPQSATQLNVEVLDPMNTSVFVGNSTPMTWAVAQKDTVATSTTFSPTSMGSHQINFWASSPLVSSDTTVRTSVVTDTVYGVDYDWNSDGTNTGGGFFLGRECGGQVLGTAYDIYAAATVTSISFHVDDNSVVGSRLKTELYEVDNIVISQGISAAAPVWFQESNDYILTAADIDSWVTLPLKTPIQVDPGSIWLASVHGEQGFAGDTSLISSTSNPNSVSYLQDNCDGGVWRSLSKGILIRMNFGSSSQPSAIQDKAFEQDVSVYPNPSNGLFTVAIPEAQKGSYLLQVKDLLGHVVYSAESIINGKLLHHFDISNFAKGMYLLEISHDNSTTTRKITLE